MLNPHTTRRPPQKVGGNGFCTQLRLGECELTMELGRELTPSRGLTDHLRVLYLYNNPAVSGSLEDLTVRHVPHLKALNLSLGESVGEAAPYSI